MSQRIRPSASQVKEGVVLEWEPKREAGACVNELAAASN